MVLHIRVPQNVRYFLSGSGTRSSSSRILLHQVIFLKCGVLLKCTVTVINFKHCRCYVWKFITYPTVLVWIIVFEISYLISEKIFMFLMCVCVCVYIQGVSRLVDITAEGDFLGLFDQKSSYKHVSDFGRLRSYDRLKLRI